MRVKGSNGERPHPLKQVHPIKDRYEETLRRLAKRYEGVQLGFRKDQAGGWVLEGAYNITGRAHSCGGPGHSTHSDGFGPGRDGFVVCVYKRAGPFAEPRELKPIAHEQHTPPVTWHEFRWAIRDKDGSWIHVVMGVGWDIAPQVLPHLLAPLTPPNQSLQTDGRTGGRS